MRIFTRMSIRLVLGQIIGVLGFLLVALSTAGLFAAIEHDTAARRVASLTHTSQQLFGTLIGTRQERGAATAVLIGEAPADAGAALPRARWCVNKIRKRRSLAVVFPTGDGLHMPLTGDAPELTDGPLGRNLRGPLEWRTHPKIGCTQ